MLGPGDDMVPANVIDVPDADVATDRWRIGRAIRVTLVVLLALVAFDALHEIFGLASSGAAAIAPTTGKAGSAAGYSNLIDSWFYDLAATGAGILMLVHALSDRGERGWILLALGTFSWVI